MTTLEDIATTLDFLGDWEQRYLYLVELGEQLPEMPAELKIEDNRVKGCMSQVWISPHYSDANSDLITFHGDCDTSTIKGVLAVLIQLTRDKSAKEIMQLDVDALFERLQLAENLSPNRHIGIYAIVELMKQQVSHL